MEPVVDYVDEKCLITTSSPILVCKSLLIIIFLGYKFKNYIKKRFGFC